MLLSLLLVSEQNEPTKNAWTPSQDENSLSMLFNKSNNHLRSWPCCDDNQSKPTDPGI